MGEEIIIQDENGKKYSILRVLDANTKKIIDDLSALVVKKEKIIDYMIEEYEYNARINLKNFCEDETRKDRCIQDCKICVKKYFEERCK